MLELALEVAEAVVELDVGGGVAMVVVGVTPEPAVTVVMTLELLRGELMADEQHEVAGEVGLIQLSLLGVANMRSASSDFAVGVAVSTRSPSGGSLGEAEEVVTSPRPLVEESGDELVLRTSLTFWGVASSPPFKRLPTGLLES